MSRRIRALAGFVALVALVAACGGATSAPAAPTIEYVALGDSFAAGPMIDPQVPGTADPCQRSTLDYPHVLATRIGATVFRDVTCSSATTENVTSTPQKADKPGDPAVPVQLDAVSPTTTLVTLTIGANDAQLAQLATGCIDPPGGASCQARLTAGGVDRGAQAIDAVGPKIAATLDAVHAKAPHARILVTSYGDYARPGGCYPQQPVLAADADYVQGLVDRLGQLTRSLVAAHHAEYVDLIAPSAGHDGCQTTGNWVNLAVHGSEPGWMPLHPTLPGEAAFATVIAGHLAAAT